MSGNGAPYVLQGEEHLFERLKREEPGLTVDALHQRLLEVRDQGLVEYFHRHGQHRWWKRADAGTGHGRVTLQFDDESPYLFWFDEEDDLRYTARRVKGETPELHEQTYVEAPYPHKSAGRRY